MAEISLRGKLITAFSFVAVLVILFEGVHTVPAPRPQPWEPYSDSESDMSMRQARVFHDTIFSGLEVAMPMVTKIAKGKWDEYRERYHGADSKAGRAGRTHSSEENNSDEEQVAKAKAEEKKKVEGGEGWGGGAAPPAPVAPVPPTPPEAPPAPPPPESA